MGAECREDKCKGLQWDIVSHYFQIEYRYSVIKNPNIMEYDEL